MKELYAGEITDPSLKELETFAKWYNDKIGNYPVIVGGWAVYCYTKGLGSKDIDVVFPGDASKHATLFAYFAQHGYIERSRTFFDKEFVKPVKSKGREVEIIIDAVSANRTIIFEGKKARLPWSWAAKHSVKHKLGNATIYIPTIELLLVYKLGAILGRSYNLRTGLDFDYYKSKLWKDVYDVLSLSKFGIDQRKAGGFFKDSGLATYKEEILAAMQDNFDNELNALLPSNSLENFKQILLSLEVD